MDSKKQLVRDKIYSEVNKKINGLIKINSDLSVIKIPIVIKRNSIKNSMFFSIALNQMPNKFETRQIVDWALDEFKKRILQDNSLSAIEVKLIKDLKSDKIAETAQIELVNL